MDKLTIWQQSLEAKLRSLSDARDGSHDIGHGRRVWRHARRIADDSQEAVDRLVLLVAAYLHDVVSLKKNDPRHAESSRLAAEKARTILSELGFPPARLDAVAHAIEAHSNSAKIQAKTLEAKILQDADRLEKLGAIGVARLFYIAGQKGGGLFHDTDPTGKNRSFDEQGYALDHYYKKLLHLPDSMNTTSGREMARKRAEVFAEFVKALVAEASENSTTQGSRCLL